MKEYRPPNTPEGRLAVARHIESLKDTEAVKVPAERRTDQQLRQLARKRFGEGTINPEGHYTPDEG